MNKNKTGKYFKYAIGEIVLVMIGILLALQVNNWNEKRKINADIDRIFILFESELKSNIDKCESLINFGYYKDSIRVLFKNKKVTRQMILDKPFLITQSFGTHTLFIEDERLNELIGQEKQLSTHYKNLVPELKRLKVRIDSRNYWESKSLDLAMTRIKEIVDQTPWFDNTDSLEIEKFAAPILNDKIFRNKVEHYNGLLLDENVWDATLVRTSSVVLLWKLKSAKDKSLTIEDFLKSLNLKPFIEYGCNESNFNKNEVLFRRNFIIYNNQSEEIIINKLFINSDVKQSYTLPAKSFLMGQIFLDSHSYIELEVDGKCKKIYDPYTEDYLIL